jgi:hypothetical protein
MIASSQFKKKSTLMKKIAIVLLGVFFAIIILESCSDRICPAYSSYPKGSRRK